jgi:hypothetical protein
MMAAAVTGVCAVAAPLYAEETRLGSEAACSEIRASISRLAQAERRQAFALRLMPKAGPTPMVAARFSELRSRIEDLRGVLTRVRQAVPHNDEYVNRCVTLGFRSLVEAEEVSSTVGDMVMSEGGGFGVGPRPDSIGRLKPGPLLPGRGLPAAPRHQE